MSEWIWILRGIFNDLGISLNIRFVTREMSVCLLLFFFFLIATKMLIAFFELIKSNLVDYVNF